MTSAPRNPTYMRRRADRLLAEEQQRALRRQQRLQLAAAFEQWQRAHIELLLAEAQVRSLPPSVLTH